MRIVGETGEREKDEFLRHSYTLLFPIDWPEPFRLVMIEAMECGMPIIAYRGGAVPEVMEEGRTGFIVKGLEDAREAVWRVPELSQKRCREVVDHGFTAARMAHDYVQVYERLIKSKQHKLSEVRA